MENDGSPKFRGFVAGFDGIGDHAEGSMSTYMNHGF
jgi:hypothetical protein